VKQTNRANKRQVRYLLIFIVAIAGGCISMHSSKQLSQNLSSAQTQGTNVKAALSQRQRTISPGLLCFNVNAFQIKQWNDPKFTDAVQSISPQVLRLPGGEGSNYWDWRRGGIIQNSQGLSNDVHAFLKNSKVRQYKTGSLKNFQTLSAATNTTPLFVLNMLTSTLESQIQMLKQAEALGMPIQEIELGNEFYFGTRNNRSVFPTPKDYARTATQWTTRIKKEFPQVKISVIGVSDQGRIRHRLEQRRVLWNRAVSTALEKADAITLHSYPGHGLAPLTEAPQGDYPFFSAQDTSIILGEPFRHWDTINQTDGFGTLPSNQKIWVTEYNLHERLRKLKVRQNRVIGSWAHGLYNLVMGLQFLEDPRVEKICNHALIGNPQFSAIFDGPSSFVNSAHRSGNSIKTTPYGLTATGVALQKWGQAMNNADEAQEIEFENGPTLMGKQQFQYPALYGWSFTDQGDNQEAIITNLSARSLQVDVSSIFPSGITYQQVEGDPRTLVTTPYSLKETDGDVLDRLSLPPYSVSHLKSKK